MPTGRIIKWDDERGFGFLRADDKSSRDNDFIHITWLPDGRAPSIGDSFEYDREVMRDGRNKLVRVRPVGSVPSAITVW